MWAAILKVIEGIATANKAKKAKKETKEAQGAQDDKDTAGGEVSDNMFGKFISDDFQQGSAGGPNSMMKILRVLQNGN